MIKVRVKETVTANGSSAYETKIVEQEHKEGDKASVHNGVLSIFPKGADKADFGKSIAGYEPSAWLSWEKV